MLKKVVNFCSICLILFLMVGCWDAVDIRDKNIVTLVLVDKTETGFSIYAEVPSISGAQISQSSQSSHSYHIRGEGKTLAEARTNLDLKSKSPWFLGATQCVIFTKRMAEHGIEEYTNRFRQIPDYRKTLFALVTMNEPEEILEVRDEEENIIGLGITDLIQKLEDLGIGHICTLSELLERIASDNKCYLMPVIEIEEDIIIVSKYAVFDRGKMEALIPADDSYGIVLLKEKKGLAEIAIPHEDNLYSVKIELKSRKFEPSYQNKKIKVKINLKIDAMLSFLERRETVSKDLLNVLQTKLKDMINSKIYEELYKSQVEIGHDYFDVYEYFRIKYPNEVKKMDWEKEYPNIEFSLQTDLILRYNDQIDHSVKTKK